MVFTSTVFLFAFLPVAVILFYVFPARLRVVPLLLASAVFYAWGEPVLVVLILLTAVFTFSWGRLIVAATEPTTRRWLLVAGIVVVLVPIAIFKYLEFALRTVGFGGEAVRLHLPLPIGVSFYTFMAIGYLIDLYRRRGTGAESLLHFAGFLTMFPHLVAGPIVRWYDIGPQLEAPRFDAGLFGYGAVRVAGGLAKKAVLADTLAVNVDQMFATGAPTSTGAAWLAAVLYSLQIYLDFSAYSDIAIGLAAMLGVRFHENFRFPYVARSAREFWQRWHISLGSWFRDYLYIPLGGSRVPTLTLWRNLLIVWGVTGLWHGAAWTFIVWGLYYGVVIGLERTVYGDALARTPRPVQHVYGLLVAVVGWVIFRSTSLHQVGEYYRAMVGLGAHRGAWDVLAGYALQQTWVLIIIGCLLAAGIARPFMDRLEATMAGVWEGEGEPAPLDTATTPAGPQPTAAPLGGTTHEGAAVAVAERTEVAVETEPARPRPGTAISLAAAAVVAVLLLVATAFIVSVNYSPFIYFRF